MKNWIRNTTLVLAAITVATVSSAQQNPRRLTEDLIREAQRVQELITREADYLTVRQLDQVKDKLQEIREIIRRGGNPYPGPGRPNPPVFPPKNPPQYPPQYGVVSVKGDIENQAFSFDIYDLHGLHTQCVAFVKSKNLTQVDDIKVSVNLGQIRILKNDSSWWRGANQICQQIASIAKANQVPTSQSNQNVVYGNIENQEFNFVGFGKADMFRQCESFVNSKNLTQVDDIVRVTNFGAERVLKNQSSWWRGTLEICQQVLAEVP